MALPGMPISSQATEFGSLFNGLIYILGYFIQVLAYFIVAVLISVFLKRGAVVVLVYFALFLVEKLFVTMLANQGIESIGDYFPLASFSSLLPNISLEFIIFGLGEVEALTPLNTFVSLLYILLFAFLTRLIFFKRDVS